MDLSDELRFGECSDSTEQFEKRVVDLIRDEFSETTADDLICHPLLAIKFCDQVRKQVGSDFLPDVVILKTLLNMRKKGKFPKDLKTVRTTRRVKDELDAVQCKMDPDQFKDLVANSINDMYREITIDQLLCHPREARSLCNFIRIKTECSGLSDDFILSTLMNARKAGLLSNNQR